MNNNRIVWGVILVILIVAALAYFGTVANLNRAVKAGPNTQKTGQGTQ
ncbi:bacteriorhodopsin [Rhizobium aquaticum]|uniref:Bacteriorhodopsin n=1 Tax=Rhizobium aquaticum TaxID=1549636 RepID=A0ABV2J2N6_9HYPH